MTELANCPSCHGFRTVSYCDNGVQCRDCDFAYQLLCFHCNIGALTHSNGQLTCQHCHKHTSTKKLAYILENKLLVHPEERCSFCNGPVLHKPSSNIRPRCLDFPHCGNQSALFETDKKESRVFLDFETTGLEIGNESIIELGACKIDADGQEYFFQEFVKPVNSISPLITKITGIDNNMVAHAPGLKPVLERFVAFCGSSLLVAHNAQFDIPWLLTSLLRHALPIQFESVVCTLNWAKKVEEGKRSLGALSKKYNIGHDNAHRALADAVVTKVLYGIYEEQDTPAPMESVDRYLAMSQKIVQQFPSFIQA